MVEKIENEPRTNPFLPLESEKEVTSIIFNIMELGDLRFVIQPTQ